MAAAAAAAAFVQKFAIIYGAVSARRNFFFSTLSDTDNSFLRTGALPPMRIVLSIPHARARAAESERFRYSSSLPEHPFPPSEEQEIQSLITLDFYRERFLSRRWARWYHGLGYTYLLRAPRASTPQSDVIELAPDIIALWEFSRERASSPNRKIPSGNVDPRGENALTFFI